MAIKTTGKGEGPRRYYDEDKPDIRYPSVTSIKDMIPKDMSWWAAKMTAELAVDLIDHVKPVAERDYEGAVKFLAGASDRYKDQRGNLGSDAHDAFERILKGERPRVEEHVRPYVDAFDKWVQRTQPEIHSAEDLAWSDEHGFAGSYDLAAWFRVNPETGRIDPQGERKLLMVDYKTGKNVYEDVALQLTAYAMAETRIDGATWERTPMPEFHGGAVLHVRESAYDFMGVRLSEDIFGVFLECLGFFHTVQRWRGSGRGRFRTPGVRDHVLRANLDELNTSMVTGTQRRG